ncbi:hypothetical protein GDO81_020147 [Engystomops pustulosus]|uniref:Uncharacterized protein n=1 Tax=Engystomops pustulosus TaxID=76066 RepID=A0AAV6YY67_ENGPU|nr:hypothetical protein GDO81_020147 [Engystomops pustulosus]
MSSAYNSSLSFGPLHPHPTTSGLSLHLIASGSKNNTNKIAETGQPCLVPLVILNSSVRPRPTLILAVGSEYISFIYLINSCPNPKPFRASQRKIHSTLSNALAASIDRMERVPPLGHLDTRKNPS